jgi:hypothetical protein
MMVFAVLYGLIRSEQLAPTISKWMDMDWIVKRGMALWQRIRMGN